MLQLFTGIVVSIFCVCIHAAITTIVVHAAHGAAGCFKSNSGLLLIATMIVTVTVLMLAHISEVVVWAVAYNLVGAAPEDADGLYFALSITPRLAMATSFP